MAVVGIVAVDVKGAIGRGGGLPWHYSSDMKFFKEQTTGHACVMGYRTWLSLKRPLPNRLNVVLTRRTDVEPRESVVWVRDRLSVLALKDYLRCDLYVIGGAQVFRDFADDIERWVVTQIPIEAEGADTFMPSDFLEGFEEEGSCPLGDGLVVSSYRRRPPPNP